VQSQQAFYGSARQSHLRFYDHRPEPGQGDVREAMTSLPQFVFLSLYDEVSVHLAAYPERKGEELVHPRVQLRPGMAHVVVLVTGLDLTQCCALDATASLPSLVAPEGYSRQQVE